MGDLGKESSQGLHLKHAIIANKRVQWRYSKDAPKMCIKPHFKYKCIKLVRLMEFAPNWVALLFVCLQQDLVVHKENATKTSI
ncbi:hypothetical protein ACO0K9_20745 [Undibacterium sp. Ji50W]|uniref:hypothetical protein n=1 Tax=Undibacterium sp. Ji50W TaxID=3413041 RepID=UPI003BF266CE